MSYTFYYDPISEFEYLFDDALEKRGHTTGKQDQIQKRGERSGGIARPRMDLHEDPKENKVEATFELPGLSKENVNIDVHNGRLTVSGEVKQSEDREESGYVVKERRVGKFSRTIQLPPGIKTEQVKAAMENGVLKVTFPKTSPESAPQKITIA